MVLFFIVIIIVVYAICKSADQKTSGGTVASRNPPGASDSLSQNIQAPLPEKLSFNRAIEIMAKMAANASPADGATLSILCGSGNVGIEYGKIEVLVYDDFANEAEAYAACFRQYGNFGNIISDAERTWISKNVHYDGRSQFTYRHWETCENTHYSQMRLTESVNTAASRTGGVPVRYEYIGSSECVLITFGD